MAKKHQEELKQGLKMIKDMKSDPKSAKKSVSKIARQAQNETTSINQTYSLEGISEINETYYDEDVIKTSPN